MIVSVIGSVGFPSRSPYGERGLKYQWASLAGEIRAVALLTESVD